MRSLAISLALVMLTVLLAGSASGGLGALRLRTADETVWYRPEFRDLPASLTLETGQLLPVKVIVRNNGILTWHASGNRHVALSYHWLSVTDDWPLDVEGVRTALPEDIGPGRELTVLALVRGPNIAGAYRLRWDMVQEDVLWFSWVGQVHGEVAVRVVPSQSATAALPPEQPVTVPERVAQPSRIELWRAAVNMWRERPFLGVGPDNFRRHYGPYLGLRVFDMGLHANSLYVETLVTLGLVGAIALIVLIGTLAWIVVHCYLERGWRHPDWLLMACALGLTAMLLHGLVDFFLPFTPTYGEFWLLAGLCVSLARIRRCW